MALFNPPTPDQLRQRRFDKAWDIEVTDDASFAERINLTSHPGDAAEPDAMVLQADAYMAPQTSYYDVLRAHQLYLAAAKRKDITACYRLAMSWRHGLFGKVDNEKCAHWLAIAADLGHGCAAGEVVKIMMADRRYATDETFREEALSRLWKAASDGWPWPIITAGRVLANVPSAENGLEIALYKGLAKNPAKVPPVAIAKTILAFRYYLGLGVDRSVAKALFYIFTISWHVGSNYVKFNLKRDAARLRSVILNTRMNRDTTTKYLSLIISRNDELLNSESPTREILNPLFDAAQRLSKEDAAGFRHFTDLIWARHKLSELEQGAASKAWADLHADISLLHLRVTKDEVLKSKNDFGVIYNQRFSHGGLIPGVYLGAHAQPPGGVGALRAIATTASGDIRFSCTIPSSAERALLFPEDFDVALALIFGGKQPVMPFVSLDPIWEHRDTPSTKRTAPKNHISHILPIEQKYFSPPWVGTTLLGKALYAADVWAAELMWTPETFRPGQADPVRNSTAISKILDELSMLGGANDGHAEMLTLRPGTIHRTWKQSGSEHGCSIINATVDILGANLIFGNKGNALANANSNAYHAGRAANLMMERFDSLATYFPVFERYRQITVLLSVLKELHGRGFRPGPDLQKRIGQTVVRFRKAKLSGAARYTL